ncbi:glycoside hydrolase family 13 protein [Streptomyces sp. NPDC093109]|uniref:glycoside hydrolase family 13 protein n=1 Tax=Streptomyces sp. NPDC093109 TaxID=3154977 RepID=UPI00344DD04D
MSDQQHPSAILTPAPVDRDWWRQAAIYQVYPRSFADSDGDGLGDLPGITSRLPYLARLGIDAIWLSPFYPSALADGGYDVADYRDVDPRLGTLDDFDALVAGAHERSIRVMVDIVPNHTSNDHVWFQEALAAAPGGPERDRYVFRQGKGDSGELPPTDWVSCFGGPAWSRLPDGWWYLHLFAPEQPDLNWDNPEVRADFLTTLRFWSDRGVDGFRVDVAHGLAKDLAEPLRDIGPVRSYEPADLPEDGSHPLWDRDEVHTIFKEWRQVFDEYEPPRVAVAEAWVRDSRRTPYASAEELGQAFNFDFLNTRPDASALYTVIDKELAAARESGASATWVLSNHDVIRHRTRYALPDSLDAAARTAWLLGDGHTPPADLELGLRRARAATLLMLALPGSSYLFQGEELGLPEVADLPHAVLQDPTWERNSHRDKGRDGCRVPLPWTRTGPSYGFGTGAAPWLPQPAVFGELAAEAQDGTPGSTLEFYREALRLRRTLLRDESLTWQGTDGTRSAGVLDFRRAGGWRVVANLSDHLAELPPGTVLLASGPPAGTPTDAGGVLPAHTTVWLRTEE